MEKQMIRCDNLSQDRINEIILSYTKLGWEFIGISEGFPKDYAWIHLEWSKPEPPIWPGTKPNN